MDEEEDFINDDEKFWEQVDLAYEKYRDDELLKKYEKGR